MSVVELFEVKDTVYFILKSSAINSSTAKRALNIVDLYTLLGIYGASQRLIVGRKDKSIICRMPKRKVSK